MKNIIIRTLGGKGIGYGHYYRCLSLAKAIKLTDEDIEIVFLINEDLLDQIEGSDFKFIINDILENDIDIIKNLDLDLFIFDSYLGNNDYLKNIKEKTRLILIDDNNAIYDSSIADIIYNGNIHAENLDYKYVRGQLRLLGPMYLIMKEEYWNSEGISTLKEGVLVTTGGTDEYKVALDIINTIKDLDINIQVIIGPGYKNDYIREIEKIKTKNMRLIYKPNSLKDYISSSKAVITAGGSTIYEILSQKSIPIVFSIANNQDLLCNSLEKIGAIYLGKYPNINYLTLKRSVNALKDREINNDEKIFNLIDGKGALNTASRIVKTLKII